jgi:CheY-like chemotaxis protein/uncharacterized protein YqfB (UPF0267 family)
MTPHDSAKILYVDDEEINLRSFTRTFRRKYSIVTATSGKEAIEILEKDNDIAVLVTDQRMPGMTGIELLENISPKFPDLPRLILTGFSDEEDIKKAVNKCGIFRYLSKPWEEDDLESALHQALELFLLRKNNKLFMAHLAKQNEHLEHEISQKVAEMIDRDERLFIQNQILDETLSEMESVLLDVQIATDTIELKEQLEDALQRLNDSISYAKNIQQAIFPQKDDFEKYVREFQFIFWAKDIVSGDFYWAKRTPHAFYFALGDCTGHGVPGAFMTVMACTLLNQVIKSEAEIAPDAALDQLHDLICHSLKQDTFENRDGLDIALCKITENNEKFLLEYCGAHRDLYYTENEQIHSLASNRFSVGGKIKQIRCFEAHTVLLSKHSRIYLFSDGVAHLPNEERNKFGRKKIISILQNSLHEPIERQKQMLENELLLHKGNVQDIRDDVSWLGIEL